jgi:uncharacterized protein (TIGR02444 family)
LADSQNGLDTGLNIDAQFATNRAENPLSAHLEYALENRLWQYACQVYSQAGVEAALLVLQDDHGADINLILQALWLASEDKRWTQACIPTDYDQWMEKQVLPLRLMRRSLKIEWVENRGSQYEGFRQQVKKLELNAEQHALAMLFVRCDQVPKSDTGLVIVNLAQLAEYLELSREKFEPLISLI